MKNSGAKILLRSIFLWVVSSAFILLTTPIKQNSLIKSGVIIVILLALLIIFRKKLKSFRSIKIAYWIIAIFIALAGAIQFCSLNHDLDYNSISQSLFHVKWIYVTVGLAFVFMLLAIPAGAYWLNVLFIDVFKIKSTHKKIAKSLLKPIGIFSVIYSVAIIAIIRANYYYFDDMGRALEGYRGWGASFSRYLSDVMSFFFHGNIYLTDISPLLQIIAIIILATASTILVYVFKNNNKFTFVDYLSAMPIVLCPYFLQCISYKFDAAYMAISIIAAIAPMLLCNFKDKSKFNYIGLLVGTFFSTIIVCTTYQVSLGILPIVVVFTIVFYSVTGHWVKNKSIKVFMFSALGYVLGLLFFYLVFMHPTEEYIDASIPTISNVIPNIIQNYQTYFSFVLQDFNLLWLALVVACIVYFVVSFTTERRGNKIFSILIAILIVIGTSLLMFGVYPVMQKPLFSPRTMYGFGVWLAIINISSINMSKNIKWMVFGKVFVCIISWVFFVFAFTYGNTLNAQKEFMRDKTNIIAYDINEISSDNNRRELKFNGAMGNSPILDNQIKTYPILQRLIYPTLGDNLWPWSNITLEKYYKLPIYVNSESENVDETHMISFKNTYDYDIKYDDKYIIVNFHEHSA